MFDFAARAERIRVELGDHHNILVTSPENVRYLTGYVGSFGAALITDSEVFLATDNRYAQAAKAMCPSANIIITRNLHRELVSAAMRGGSEHSVEVCVEGDHLSASALRSLQTEFPHLSFSLTQSVIERVRICKDDQEVAAIARACDISVTALAQVIPQVVVGMSEIQLAQLLERTMINLGAEAVGFPSIVASGPNSAIPHHSPSNRELAKGDLLKIDFGARVDGYHADCTRTFSIGKAADWQREIYQVVAQAQQCGRDVLISDPIISHVDQSVRNSIAAAGFAEHFTHGLGHGVGLAIHELPFFSASSTDRIEPNTVLTIEPGIYLDDRGGVRIEDTVLVGQHGYENLTDFSYELLELCI